MRASSSAFSSSAVLLFLLVSGVCLVSGVLLLASSLSESRERAVRKYSVGVADWRHGQRRALRESNVALQVHAPAFCRPAGEEGSTPLPMRRVVDPDVLHDVMPEDLPEYSPLRFALPLSELCRWPSQLNATLHTPLNVSFYLNISGMGTGAGADENSELVLLAETASRALLKIETRPAATPNPPLKCKQAHGQYKRHQCFQYFAMSNLCYQFELPHKDKEAEGEQKDPADQNTTGDAPVLWTLHNRGWDNSSSGCHYNKAAHDWEAEEYSLFDITKLYPTYNLAEKDPASVFRNTEIVFRSWKDPYLLAMELTNGSLDFGMASADQQRLGYVLLVMGMLMLLHPVTVIYRRFTRGDSPYEAVFQDSTDDDFFYDDEDDAGQDGYADDSSYAVRNRILARWRWPRDNARRRRLRGTALSMIAEGDSDEERAGGESDQDHSGGIVHGEEEGCQHGIHSLREVADREARNMTAFEHQERREEQRPVEVPSPTVVGEAEAVGNSSIEMAQL